MNHQELDTAITTTHRLLMLTPKRHTQRHMFAVHLEKLLARQLDMPNALRENKLRPTEAANLKVSQP